MIAFDPQARMVQTRCLKRADPDTLEIKTPTYVMISGGRFSGSTGRVTRIVKTTKHGWVRVQMYVYFEPGGHEYKLDCTDYGGDWIVAGADDSVLSLEDKLANKAVPTIKDRYGNEVKIGTMLVVHTYSGLKIGTVQKITPGGTMRLKDFDDRTKTFSKIIYGQHPSPEIMILQKDFMDQLMIRKLSQ
jgi:hypothetical protein